MKFWLTRYWVPSPKKARELASRELVPEGDGELAGFEEGVAAGGEVEEDILADDGVVAFEDVLLVGVELAWGVVESAFFGVEAVVGGHADAPAVGDGEKIGGGVAAADGGSA